MRNTMRAGAIASAALVGLVACGGDPQGQQEIDPDELSGTLSFATWQFLEPGRGDAIAEAIEAYTEENPDANIERVEGARADYEQTMSTQLGAGDGPDILIIPDPFFPELAESGLLEPLDVAIDESGVDNLHEVHEDFNVEGDQLAVLWEIVPYALFWNQELLDEAGVEPPSDVESLIQASQAISEETGATGFTVRHQMNEEEPWWTDFSNWPFGFGGSWSDGSNLTIDSPENIEALEAFKEVYESDGFGQGQDASTYRGAFSSGELGMAIDNSGYLASETLSDDQIGSAILPFPEGGSAFAGFSLGVNANAENTDLALDFVRWLLEEETQQEFADVLFPSVVATGAEPSDDLLEEYPWAEGFFDQVESGLSNVIIEGFEARTPEIRTIVLTQVARALTGDVTPEEALQEAQEQAESLVG